MHVSWFMHLFIFVLFSLLSPGKATVDYESEEPEDTDNFIAPSKTTASSTDDEDVHDYEDSGVTHDVFDTEENTKKITTPMTKTTIHSIHSDENHAEYYEHDDETEDEKISSTTRIASTLLSSSRKIKLSTHVITETTTSKAEIPLTLSVWAPSNERYHFYIRTYSTTTISPEQIAAYLSKTNRDRLFLKIFVITVSVGMVILAIALITIHQVRKTRRYGQYQTPANASSNQQSKHLNNIRI